MRNPLPPIDQWQDRYWRKVTIDNSTPDSHWMCHATPGTAYSQFRFGKDIWYGHELAVVLDGRELGDTVDHLCRVLHCVRPSHLEVVTHAENTRRGWNVRREPGYCLQGHDQSVYGYRRKDRPGRTNCTACANERKRRRRLDATQQPVAERR